MDWKSRIDSQLWWIISNDPEAMLLILLDVLYGAYRNN